jgi:ligand-binding SRPBCC domain-containing protein
MTITTLYTKLLLPIPIETAWGFFSNPNNLQFITPPKLSLKILEEKHLPKEIYAGLLIHYYVTILGSVKADWLTEITHVIPRKLFVDEQRFGPYAFWHHRHLFHSIPEGTVMEDIVTYKPPCGILGNLFLSTYIKKQLHSIFVYRTQKIQELFPGSQSLVFED